MEGGGPFDSESFSADVVMMSHTFHLTTKTLTFRWLSQSQRNGRLTLSDHCQYVKLMKLGGVGVVFYLYVHIGPDCFCDRDQEAGAVPNRRNQIPRYPMMLNRCRLSSTANINALSDVDEDDSDSDGTPDDGKAKSKKRRKKRRKSATFLKITFPENSLVKRITVNECLELLL